MDSVGDEQSAPSIHQLNAFLSDVCVFEKTGEFDVISDVLPRRRCIVARKVTFQSKYLSAFLLNTEIVHCWIFRCL